MAFKIVWSNEAREDLRDIVLFIARDNPSVAETFGYLLMNKVDLLEAHPELGRVVPEIGDPQVRELILRSYRIVYRILPEAGLIAIARIWHAARGAPDVPPTSSF